MTRSTALNPAFLIAAAINDEGNLDLLLPMPVGMSDTVRMEFSLGQDGEILQRPYVPSRSGMRPEPQYDSRRLVEWTTLAECLHHTFGSATPKAFQLTESVRGETRMFVRSGTAHDRERLRLIHDAFNVYVIAYEAYAT